MIGVLCAEKFIFFLGDFQTARLYMVQISISSDAEMTFAVLMCSS